MRKAHHQPPSGRRPTAQPGPQPPAQPDSRPLARRQFIARAGASGLLIGLGAAVTDAVLAPAAQAASDSRSLTIGTYRGNNALYTYMLMAIPMSITDNVPS